MATKVWQKGRRRTHMDTRERLEYDAARDAYLVPLRKELVALVLDAPVFAGTAPYTAVADYVVLPLASLEALPEQAERRIKLHGGRKRTMPKYPTRDWVCSTWWEGLMLDAAYTAGGGK